MLGRPPLIVYERNTGPKAGSGKVELMEILTPPGTDNT